MNTEPPAATWSGIADWYDNLLQSGSGPHELAVETLPRLSTAHGADVLDIACGQGHASRALARAGARSRNPQGVRRAGNHHRTLSTYLNTILTCGFTLELVDEPTAGTLLAQQQPVYRAIPIFFAARVRKTH